MCFFGSLCLFTLKAKQTLTGLSDLSRRELLTRQPTARSSLPGAIRLVCSDLLQPDTQAETQQIQNLSESSCGPLSLLCNIRFYWERNFTGGWQKLFG